MESLSDDIIRLLFHSCREVEKPTPTLDWGRPNNDVQLPKVRGVASALRLVSRRFKDVIDDEMWHTVRIRSTASSMYGLHWLITSNPRLCQRIQAIEYHLSPSPYCPQTPQFGSPLDFLINRTNFNRRTFEMRIGQVVPPWGEPRDVYERYRLLQHPEIRERASGHRTTPLQYANNYRMAEATFYNHNMDFTYLVTAALASRSLPNLRKFTVSNFSDEEFPLWWQMALNSSADRGAVNDALTGVPVGEVFERPDPDKILQALLQPAIRAFYVVLYGLWRRNTQTTRVTPISDLTFQSIPDALDLLPNYWQYWTPAALRPISSFSCLNISHELSMVWVFGYFRLHILRPMSETVEVLKLGYTRWDYSKPSWIHRQEDYYNPGPNLQGLWDNNYNQKAGSETNNVLSLILLLMPFIDPPPERSYRRDWDPNVFPTSRAALNRDKASILELETFTRLIEKEMTDPTPSERIERSNRTRSESWLPRLRELRLKPWLTVANIETFTNSFCMFLHQWNEKKASALERQHVFSRVHLEALNLPAGLHAELDPSTGLMVNSWKRPTWEEVILRIETAPSRDGRRAPNPTVTHDNLWQDTTDPQQNWQWITSPGGGRIIAWHRANTHQVFIKPWGECWSWRDDEAKQNRYMERVANRAPFNATWVIVPRILSRISD